jgi:hypothetical protein
MSNVKNIPGCWEVVSPTTPEIIDQIHELILKDRRNSAKLIAEQLGIPRERVGSIIHKDLDKLVACFHPGRAKDLSAPPVQSFKEVFMVWIYGFWLRASPNLQIKQPTRCTLSCKTFYCLVV